MKVILEALAYAGTTAGDGSLMDNPRRLEPGSQVRCPHCGGFHPAIKPYDVGTPYTQQMLFVMSRRSVLRGAGG